MSTRLREPLGVTQLPEGAYQLAGFPDAVKLIKVEGAKARRLADLALHRSDLKFASYRDLYSLRWTFVSLARASGEAAFNVSRVIGHARSTIVDTIYAHTVDSALAGVSESVAERIGLTAATPPENPPPPRQIPKLRLIAGGQRVDGQNQPVRDVRRTIDDARAQGSRRRTTD